jgi:hypothetical protein
MVSNPNPTQPAPINLDEIKKQKEIDKIDQEIKEMSKSGKRFLIGSVGVPLFVALATLGIFAVSGFFDTHEKLIDIAKHDFKEDTIAFAKTKAVILAQIEVLKVDSTILRDSIEKIRSKMHTYVSLIGSVYKNAQGKDRTILNLSDSISALWRRVGRETQLYKNSSDSIPGLIQVIKDLMGEIDRYRGQRELIYDLRTINERLTIENTRLHHENDSLRILHK